jgi:aldo/keto reductase family protein
MGWAASTWVSSNFSPSAGALMLEPRPREEQHHDHHRADTGDAEQRRADARPWLRGLPDRPGGHHRRGGDRAGGPSSGRETSAPVSPGSPPRPARPTRRWSTCSPASPTARGATPAQIALAWLLAQKPWIVPIPGTRRLERLEENLGAAQAELTTSDLGAIDTAATQIRVVGDRYPEAMQRMIDR